MCGIVGQSKLSCDGKRLRCEGFVELDHVHLSNAEFRERKDLATGRHRTDAHDAWRNTRGGGRNDARSQPEPVLRRGRLARKQ